MNARPHPADAEDPGDDLERQQVWSEVDRLPDRQRAVLFLRFRADLAFEDIGMTLGITASAGTKPLHTSARNLTNPPRRGGRLMDDRRIEAESRPNRTK